MKIAHICQFNEHIKCELYQTRNMSVGHGCTQWLQ